MSKRLFTGLLPDVTARLSALILAGVLVLSVLGYSALHFGWFDQGPEYQAEFTDAWPLVPGMDVRVSGAVVGSVRGVQLTNHGSALVTFQLRPGIPTPRADASVAIRQDDLLGDSDLSLELGTAPQPLRGPIPASRAIQAPRLDDFLNTFRAPVRAGLQAFLVEVGTAMENRGADVNDAILRLRPGFQALGNVFVELGDQIGSLKQVLQSADAVTGQLASRSRDLGTLVDGLEHTVTGVAAQSRQLDAGLAQLPITLAGTQATLQHLATFDHAVVPLAQTLNAAAPGFTTAATRLTPYAHALSSAARFASPTISLAGSTLRAIAPTVAALDRTKVSDLLNPASGAFAALKPLFDNLATALFGSPSGVGGLGGVVVPGNDATSPNVDPARDYIGAYLVIGCQLFGVPATPGCLSDILSTYFPSRSAAGTSTGASAPHSSATAGSGAGPANLPAATGTPATSAAPPTAPSTGATGSTGLAGVLGSGAQGLGSLLGFLLGR